MALVETDQFGHVVALLKVTVLVEGVGSGGSGQPGDGLLVGSVMVSRRAVHADQDLGLARVRDLGERVSKHPQVIGGGVAADVAHSGIRLRIP